MIKAIPFFSSLVGEGTTTEILLYGLIETLSVKEGYCYASSDYMAEQLGLSAGTIKNLLSTIRNKGWVEVTVEGNKRIAIQPLLGIKPVEKPVENSARASRKNDATVTEKLRYRHGNVTLSPDKKQGSDNIIDNKVNNKKENKEKSGVAGLAGSWPAGGRRPVRKDFETDEDFEKAYYAFNSIKI